MNGDLFLFVNESRNLWKVLVWDESGLLHHPEAARAHLAKLCATTAPRYTTPRSCTETCPCSDLVATGFRTAPHARADERRCYWHFAGVPVHVVPDGQRRTGLAPENSAELQLVPGDTVPCTCTENMPFCVDQPSTMTA
jgi:hypothetical protein